LDVTSVVLRCPENLVSSPSKEAFFQTECALADAFGGSSLRAQVCRDRLGWLVIAAPVVVRSRLAGMRAAIDGGVRGCERILALGGGAGVEGEGWSAKQRPGDPGSTRSFI
jgi:hypothetical protein